MFAALLAACSNGGSPSPIPGGAPSSPATALHDQPAAAVSTQIDWPTFGFNRQRHAFNGAERTLTPSTVPHLVEKWTFALGSRYVDTQPIVAANVNVSGTVHQIVYVGDETGDFYGVDAMTGQALWSKTLGKTSTACGTHSDGITSAPVIDRAKNRIYVLDGLATMWAFDLATGQESPGFAPKVLYADPSENHTWSALTLSKDHTRVYFETASHCDAGTYYGTVNAINTTSQHISTFKLVTNPATYYGNGSWSWGGATIDPDNENIFASVGNSQGSLGEKGQYSDSVIELTPALGFVADEQPETSNLSNDLDIGATPVPYDDQGTCIAFERKDGQFFTADRSKLANNVYASDITLGGQLAAPAYSPITHSLYAAVPNGETKLAIGPNCTVTVAWQTQISASGVSPNVIAGNVVYAAGGSTLYAINATTGAILWTSGTTIPATITAAPTIVNGRLYAAASNGHLYAFGL